MAPSSSGPGYLVLIQKIAGSNPAGVTKFEKWIRGYYNYPVMPKTKLFKLLAVFTLIVGFAFHILYTDGSIVISNNDDTTATVYSVVIFTLLPLFAIFTCLAFLSRGRSVAASLLFTLLIVGAVLFLGVVSAFAIGLSAI